MAKFLLLYLPPADGGIDMSSLTEEQQAEHMQAWGAWFGKAGDAVVDMGAPLAPVADAASIGGYSIVEAADEAALASLLEGHPAAQFGVIDAHELQAVPGM